MSVIYFELASISTNRSSNFRGFTVAIGLDKKIFEGKNVNIFLSMSFNICFWCSKELSHLHGCFEYP